MLSDDFELLAHLISNLETITTLHRELFMTKLHSVISICSRDKDLNTIPEEPKYQHSNKAKPNKMGIKRKVFKRSLIWNFFEVATKKAKYVSYIMFSGNYKESR